MTRAGVFIGVDKTGNLQVLKDAAAGAQRMHQWALGQGIVDQTHAKLITDAGGKRVHPDLIYDAIKEIIDGPGVDQLIVYFAGHGVNINRSEQWLLTEAPVKTSAAVNLSGSVELARYCGIKHVVFISDACRVAPEGLQAQNVRGVDIFPNDGAIDRTRPVDQFFACFLGRTAAELKDPAEAAQTYSALYTNALLEALSGQRQEVIELSDTAGDTSRYVRASKLESYLEGEIPRRVTAMQLQGKVNQNPDAIITVGGEWLSCLPPSSSRSRLRSARRAAPIRTRNLRSVAQDLVRSATAGSPADLGTRLQSARTDTVVGIAELAHGVTQVAAPFGPDHFETQCGIKVRGAGLIGFLSPHAHGELLSPELLRIHQSAEPAVSVLLKFDGGTGAVIPALRGFLAALTFDDGELVDVAYEPSANDWRWDLYEQSAARVRNLRAVAASSSRYGRFRLEQEDAVEIAQNMQYAKRIDPTLAVYAAYAYHDLQMDDRIRQMSEFLQGDIGVTFFDLALLARELVGGSVDRRSRIVPFFPLLSQGWALLNANRVRLHPALEGVERNMRDSLWSLFDGDGVDKLTAAMQTGDLL
jgi:hypothetical protein